MKNRSKCNTTVTRFVLTSALGLLLIGQEFPVQEDIAANNSAEIADVKAPVTARLNDFQHFDSSLVTSTLSTPVTFESLDYSISARESTQLSMKAWTENPYSATEQMNRHALVHRVRGGIVLIKL